MRIALISDTHLAAIAQDFTHNCEAAMAWIDNLGVDLAVHLGDVTADGINQPGQFVFARKILEGLATPLRLLPGNHDIGDNPSPGIEPKEVLLQPPRLDLYRHTFGVDRWSFDAMGWTIIGLNSLLFCSGDPDEAAQLDWLDETLGNVTGPIGLMLHKPLFRNGPEDTELHPRYVPKPVRTQLMARLGKHDLRFVACGHTHQLRRTRVGGVEHVWTPSTAFFIPDTLQERIGEKVVGVMLLTLTPDDHGFEFQVPPGVLAHDICDYEAIFPEVAKMRSAGVPTRGHR